MSSVRTNEEDLRMRTTLLRQVTELLMWELSTISDRKWEDLPELKRRKTEMAGRLREIDWTAGEHNDDAGSLELLMLRSQITDLEYQSKQKISMQLAMVRQQLDVLRDQKQGWLDCVSSYVKKGGELAGKP
jgi:hypothetical protein